MQANERFELIVQVSNATNLSSASFYLVYNPEFLVLEEVMEGSFLKGDNKPTVFVKKVEKLQERLLFGLHD